MVRHVRLCHAAYWEFCKISSICLWINKVLYSIIIYKQKGKRGWEHEENVFSSSCVLFHKAFLCHPSIYVKSSFSNFLILLFIETTFCVILAVAIINCTWLGDHLTCDTAQGYQFNNTVTDDVIIQVPQSSHNHSGMYACYVMGTVSRSFEPCEFNIRPGDCKSIFLDRNYFTGWFILSDYIIASNK